MWTWQVYFVSCEEWILLKEFTGFLKVWSNERSLLIEGRSGLMHGHTLGCTHYGWVHIWIMSLIGMVTSYFIHYLMGINRSTNIKTFLILRNLYKFLSLIVWSHSLTINMTIISSRSRWNRMFCMIPLRILLCCIIWLSYWRLWHLTSSIIVLNRLKSSYPGSSLSQGCNWLFFITKQRKFLISWDLVRRDRMFLRKFSLSIWTWDSRIFCIGSNIWISTCLSLFLKLLIFCLES